MKPIWLLVIVMAATTVCAVSVSVHAASAQPAPAAKPVSPFACDRIALDPAARKRHFDELGPQLRAAITGVRELPDGYEFRFAADPATIQHVAEWAAGERACCPFFDIGVRIVAEGGPMWLRLTGRPGTKTFIEQDAADWLKHPRVTN